MILPEWLPIKQYSGYKIIDALHDIGVVAMFWDSPENNQVQCQFDMIPDNGISIEALNLLKEKLQCNSLEVRTFFDNDQDKDRTVIELIYSKGRMNDINDFIGKLGEMRKGSQNHDSVKKES